MPTFTRGEIEKLILVLPPGLDNCSWDEAKALKFQNEFGQRIGTNPGINIASWPFIGFCDRTNLKLFPVQGNTRDIQKSKLTSFTVNFTSEEISDIKLRLAILYKSLWDLKLISATDERRVWKSIQLGNRLQKLSSPVSVGRPTSQTQMACTSQTKTICKHCTPSSLVGTTKQGTIF